MVDTRAPVDGGLLALCAILRWFDRDLLVALDGHGEPAIEPLLAGELAAPSPASAGAYELREDVRAGALARLRAERPLDELRLHTCAFEHFLRRLEQGTPDDDRQTDEEACLYHLGELRLLLTERREWHTLAGYVAAVRATGPRRARHLHQLTLYDGIVAVRTQEYSRGEAILGALLDEPDLADDLGMVALNFLAQAHWYQTRYDRALALYQRVHALATALDDLMYQGMALTNMSLVYEYLDYHDQALQLSLRSLEVFRQLGHAAYEAAVLSDLGRNAMKLGRWQVAQEHTAEAIRLCESLGLEARLANLSWGQGFLHHMLGDEAGSEAAYLRGLAIAQSPEHGDPAVAMDILLYLGFHYETQGRGDTA